MDGVKLRHWEKQHWQEVDYHCSQLSHNDVCDVTWDGLPVRTDVKVMMWRLPELLWCFRYIDWSWLMMNVVSKASCLCLICYTSLFSNPAVSRPVETVSTGCGLVCHTCVLPEINRKSKLVRVLLIHKTKQYLTMRYVRWYLATKRHCFELPLKQTESYLES